VYRQLETDFPPKSIEWIKHVKWVGPVNVPLDEVDFSKKEHWKAWREKDKIKRFVNRIEGGWKKPVILVARPR
jgi:hypothetical protein